MLPFILALLSLFFMACALWCHYEPRDAFFRTCLIGAYALILLAVYYTTTK